VNRFVNDGPVQPRVGAKMLATKTLATKTLAADETRLELTVVLVINVVLWSMVAATIYGFVQQILAPKIGSYPIVAFLQITTA